MIPEKLAERLRASFLQELGDHVSDLNRNFLALEKLRKQDQKKRQDLLNELFRSAHTLKGAARSAGVSQIEHCGHHLENLLEKYRREGSQPGQAVFRILFEAVDAIEDAGQLLRSGIDLHGTRIETILHSLEAVEDTAKADVPDQAGAHIPPISELKANFKSAMDARRKKSNISSPKDEHKKDKTTARKRNSNRPAKERLANVAPLPDETPLESAESSSQPVTTEAPRKPRHLPSHSAKATPARRDASETVRVLATKLDTMLSGSGQLLRTCNEIFGYGDEIRHLRNFVEGWRRDQRAEARQVGLSKTGTSPERENRLQELEKLVSELSRSFFDTGRRLSRSAHDLDQEIHSFRLFPFADACQNLERTVRDLASETKKKISLQISGGETELDRSVLECLKGPLLHLVRNAADHGIESPDERRDAGKSLPAVIHVQARLLGDRIEVLVEDDGRGVNESEILKAKNISPQDNRYDLLELLAEPGFSTASIITEVSGRGVGLDAVKTAIESIGGHLEMSTTPGKGTRFTLTTPLTITTLRVVLVQSGGNTFALPTHAVERMTRVDRESIRSVEGKDIVTIDDKPVAIRTLSSILGLSESRLSENQSGKVHLLIISSGNERVGIVVDHFADTRQVVAKKLGRRVGRLPLIAGSTLLEGERLALILNTTGLLSQSRKGGHQAQFGPVLSNQQEQKPARIIYSEDSPTTRSLVSSILASQGYEVVTAVDGQAGWEKLQEIGADAVVSDVDMPRMNGFEFALTVRNSREFGDLPVILVTARETDEDKKRGLESGAKPASHSATFCH